MKRFGGTMCAVALISALVIAVPLFAQQQASTNIRQYTVTDIGTLGGTFGLAFGVNNKDWVNGFAKLPGDESQHGFLWIDGKMIDLGTLGGPNSQAYGRLNERGDVPGYADTNIPDPLGEDACLFGTYLICEPFVWRNYVKERLATLGGNNGWAFEANNSGQIVGTAENSTPDPNCLPPQVLEFKPVIWQKGEVRELPTYPGDRFGEVLTINDKGQAAGASGSCFTSPEGFFVFWRHPLLWENGKMTYLGTFGGSLYNIASQINNKGQVVGSSTLPGDASYHAFLWQRTLGSTSRGTMQDLGVLPGDLSSDAYGINEEGQIVGQSCDVEGNCRAVLWQGGKMFDLNSFIVPGTTSLYLLNAYTINAHGSIVGTAFDTSSNEFHAYLARSSRAEVSGMASPSIRPLLKPSLPESIRKLLHRR